MDTDRYTSIDRYGEVVDTIAELTWHRDEVMLCFENTRIHYPVSVVSVDRALNTFVIDISSLGDVDSALADERAFVLHALLTSSALYSTPTRIKAIVRREDRLTLRCWLPEALLLSQHRNYFRAVLGAGMRVEVSLCAGDGARWDGVLCDLSERGCLLRLPIDRAGGLAPGSARYPLSARFPNGETFETCSRVTHVNADAAGGATFIGLTFDIGFDDKDREVWFYVREIEREVARQSNERPELRALAPSRLFRIDPQTADTES